MSDELRDQIFNTLRLRETDELLEIWITNDRVEWSDNAFEVIQEILNQRLGELPKQKNPVLEHFAPDSIENYEASSLREIFKNPERKPFFYNPKQVLEMVVGMNRTSILAIVIIFFSNVPEFIKVHEIIRPVFPTNPAWNGVALQISIIVGLSLTILESIVVFFSLRGLAAALRILMEMEHNSRVSGMASKENETDP
jgi:hypothetical protein